MLNKNYLTYILNKYAELKLLQKNRNVACEKTQLLVKWTNL